MTTNELLAVNSICAKISVLLSIDADYNYSKSDLLYHLAISDFCEEDGSLGNRSIRNINSILYYSKYMNDVLLKLQVYNLAIIEGDRIRCSSVCEHFSLEYCNELAISMLIKTMKTAHELCLKSRDIKTTYSNLYDKYINRKLGVEIDE